MTIRQTQLAAPTQVASSATAYITAPANTAYRIGRACLCNPTGAAVTFTAYLVPPAGSPTAGNELVSAQSVAPGSTYVSPELAGLVIPAGASLQLLASATASLVFYASGISIQ